MLKTMHVLLLLPVLSACSTMPSGPNVLVLQGADKDFSQFHNDDTLCRNLAHQQVVTLPVEPSSLEEGQQDYDIVYIQCMYGKGHRIPVPEDVIYGALQDWEAPPPVQLPPER